ncbi:hypothetical protein KCV07_g270, partial [Aureobasidium melanogenum]
MSTLPAQQSAAKPSSGAVSTPDKQPSTKHFQSLVTLIVGKEKKAYTLHKDLLCFYSDYFRAAFNGSFKEAAERKLELPDVDKDVFEQFQLWLYTRNLPNPTGTVCSYWLLVKMWIFGDRLQISLLQNQIMDSIFAMCLKSNIFNPAVVPTVYAQTTTGSSLRKAVIEILAWATRIESEPDAFFSGLAKDWTSESFIDLVIAINESRKNNDVIYPNLPKRDNQQPGHHASANLKLAQSVKAKERKGNGSRSASSSNTILSNSFISSNVNSNQCVSMKSLQTIKILTRTRHSEHP